MTALEVAMSQAQQKPSVSPEPEKQVESPHGSTRWAVLRERGFSAFTHARERMNRALAEILSGEVAYQKGEGYPRVRILRNGIVSVPIEELLRSAKSPGKYGGDEKGDGRFV